MKEQKAVERINGNNTIHPAFPSTTVTIEPPTISKYTVINSGTDTTPT